jgi:outer membrane protein insertion porin family
MHNARRGITAAGVVLLWCASAVTVEAQALRQVVQQPEITKLKFTGNANISSDELQAAIATEGSHCKIFLVCKAAKWNWAYKRITLDRAELERDLLRLRVLYWKRGWRAATVTPQVTSEGKQKVSILLRVTEGPPTTIGTLTLGAIDSLLTTNELRKLIDVRPGQPLDLIHLDSIAVRIALHLDGEGYGDVTINPVAVVDDNSPNAAVTFEIARLYRTRVEAVRVEGTERYDPRLVANTMRIKPGDDYSRGAVAESQRALYEAGFFKRAVVRVDSGSADSLKKLIALVEELPVRAFRITGGVSTVDFLQLDARYTDANFRNSAGRLTLQATLGNVLASKFNGRTPFVNALPDGLLSDSQPVYLQPTFQVNADIRRRWLRDSRNQTGLSVFGYRRSSPGVFIDQGGGAGASFTRNVSRAVPLSIQYRLEFTKVSAADTYFCVNFGVCDQTSLSVLKRTQRLAPLAITASSDRRDDPIGPTTGYTWRSELELADRWTGSQLGYARVELEGSKYFHASDKLTIAVHGRAGYVRGFSRSGNTFGQSTAPVILPRKRFYAGGARSVRGYGENQLGPRVLVIPRNAFQPSAADFVRFFTDDSLLQRRVPCTPLVNLPDCSTDSLAAPVINRRGTSNFKDGDFTPKPLGAETLVEGSIEARYRFWGPLTFAAFIDAGSVGAQFGGTATVFTPGIGLRFISPVGPIRVDIGYNPKSEERLSVITELVPSDAGWLAARGSTQREGLFEITNKRIFNPSTGTGLGGVLNRLTLHLSIGEAF